MSKKAIHVSLRGQAVIMTGGTGFLDTVVVKALLFEGAHVVSLYRNEDKQKELEPRNP
jgi:NAD(P)-dependent dehydrogenase (short-subunit alcohol dehydrogenase family)